MMLQEKTKENNSKSIQTPDHPHEILIIGGS